MAGRDFTSIVMEALLGLHLVIWDYATARTAVAVGAVVQDKVEDKKQGARNNNGLCGWMGVGVSPMTAAFAESLGMAKAYGAIFDKPKPGSPAATAGIEQGDVLTAINGSPLMRASDFAKTISMMAPDTTVSLDIWRNGEAIQVKLILGSAKCGRM